MTADLTTDRGGALDEPALVYTAARGWHLAPSPDLTAHIRRQAMTAETKTAPEFVLTMLKKGRSVEFISGSAGWPIGDIIDLATEHDIAIVTDDMDAPRPSRVPPVAASHTKPVALAPVRDNLRDRIDAAAAHPSKRVQAQARRITDAIDRLNDLLREDEARHADKRKRAQEKAAARAEVDRLAAELAKARARLRGKPAPTAKPAGTTDPKTIRAWAKANGVDCPDRGMVPRRVVDAYHAAAGG